LSVNGLEHDKSSGHIGHIVTRNIWKYRKKLVTLGRGGRVKPSHLNPANLLITNVFQPIKKIVY
jgi:hypothetical protein